MKYMLLTYLDEKAWANRSEAERQEIMSGCKPHVEQLVASGKFLDGAPLHPTSMSTTITVRDGKKLVTDGPFAETREQLGGYSLIEAQALDEAIGRASGVLGTKSPATSEIRPVARLDWLPAHS